MPQPWRCWDGIWAARAGAGGAACGRGWDYVVFKVPSSPNRSVTLRSHYQEVTTVSWACRSCATSSLSCARGASGAGQFLLCEPAPCPVWCHPQARAAPRPRCFAVGHFFWFVHVKDGRG